MRTSFVPSSGSAYARFRRSLDSGSVTNALAAAAELKPLGLTDSLELLLLLRDKLPEKYPHAPLHWHARLVCEVSSVDLVEGQAVLAALAALAGERKRNAAFALAELL